VERKKGGKKGSTYSPQERELALKILDDVRSGVGVNAAIRRHPRPQGGHLGKHALVHTYRTMVEAGAWPADPSLLRNIRMKPVRTLSGVTTVTVLTKPYPCPGKCIFCPDDARMPKSYLPDEPGAMRALQHAYDPFRQTNKRIQALHEIGHPTDKIELLVLGGTWSAYPEDYQAWFLKRCLDAMNGFDAASLAEAQQANESAQHRNVGLVIETRPDWINLEEIKRLRALGVTKVQIGVQSMDDAILALNQRGHTVEQSRAAMRLLRAAGLKVVVHWMPNLLGATLESDAEDFTRLWVDEAMRPDEIKIYPCQLLARTGLYEQWERGAYQPYTTQQLINLLADIKPQIPRYCRVNRIVRDIPSPNVVEGNKRTSLRQDVQRELVERGTECVCIRCREVRREAFDLDSVSLEELVYAAGWAEEHFISYSTQDDRLAGYVRLSLPGADSVDLGLPDLRAAALIREVHVYGQSLPVGDSQALTPQHSGLGTRLMARAEELAQEHGYRRVAVIAALGTRGYYRKLGYSLGETYMAKSIG